jgi:hypothetical protein
LARTASRYFGLSPASRCDHRSVAQLSGLWNSGTQSEFWEYVGIAFRPVSKRGVAHLVDNLWISTFDLFDPVPSSELA